MLRARAVPRPAARCAALRGVQVAAALAGVALLGVACAHAESPTPGSELGSAGSAEGAPALVVLLAIDQLRPDRLSAAMPGGFGRLMREGRVFQEGVTDHAFTETCPGHVTMLTGRHPGPAGIPGNSFVERATLKRRYCVEDQTPEGALLGRESAPREGRSPRNIRVTALGDWLKEQRPDSRVFSVSAKDRAAIAMGGKRPDAVFWLDRKGGGRMTSSRYYLEALPAWVAAWRGPRLLRDVPERWEHPSGPVPEGGRIDDYQPENPQFSRFSPHPLRVVPDADPKLDARQAIGRLYASAYLDLVTLDFVDELIGRANIGRGKGTDLLAVSLSGTDIVGHSYGPESWEARDALERLDVRLDAWLAALEERVGERGLVVVMTADHGVLPVPEWLQETGRSACRLERGRGSLAEADAALAAALDTAFGPALQLDETQVSEWFVRASGRLTLNRELVEEMGLQPQAVLDAAETFLEAQAGVRAIWTQEEILNEKGPPLFAALYRNSLDRDRSGDLQVQVTRDCLFASFDFGTSHGSPYDYDRRVPLVFWGSGVEAGVLPGRARTIDIAPTLGERLGLRLPVGLDGVPLPIADPPPAD